MSQGVLFDLDETLIDRQASISAYARQVWSDFEGEIGLPFSTFLERFLALDNHGYTDRPTFFAHLGSRLSAPALRPDPIESHFREKAWAQPVLMDGAVSVSASLRAAGLKIAIVTNGRSRNQRKKLRNTGLDQLVDAVVISGELGVRKPEAAIFLEACRRLGVEPQSSWFVGDNPAADIVGASDVGLKTVWLRGALPWPEGVAPCYTHRADSLTQALTEITRV